MNGRVELQQKFYSRLNTQYKHCPQSRDCRWIRVSHGGLAISGDLPPFT